MKKGIQEGKIKKGGVNRERPIRPRPTTPPAAQGSLMGLKRPWIYGQAEDGNWFVAEEVGGYYRITDSLRGGDQEQRARCICKSLNLRDDAEFFKRLAKI